MDLDLLDLRGILDIILLAHHILTGHMVLIDVNHLVAESSSDLLERLPSCLREVEVAYDEEEGRAADEDVVVVLADVRKRARAGLGDGDVDNEVRCCGEPHDLAPYPDREDLGAVEPRRAIHLLAY